MSVYHNPEELGLTTVGEVQWTHEAYQFDITAVFLDRQGTLFWGHDTGCSCPTPFEDFSTLSDFTSGSFMELTAALNKRLDGAEEHAAGQVADLLGRVYGARYSMLVERGEA